LKIQGITKALQSLSNPTEAGQLTFRKRCRTPLCSL